MAKIISAQEAVALVRDGATVGIGGFGGFAGADEILAAMGARFRESGSPKGLTLVAGICPGSMATGGVGLSLIADDGLVKTVIAAHNAQPREISKAIGENRIAGFMLPLGVHGHLLRALAGKKPGVITHVGLHTFADPREEGCMVNELARKEGRTIVELCQMGGKEYLFYKATPMDICLIRGTYADEDGNISLEQEALLGEQLEMAMAVHNNGGIVVVQVQDIVKCGSLRLKNVHIHRSLVDYVVKASPEHHRQGYDTPEYRPYLTGETRIPVESIPPMKLSPRKVIGRRGAMELRPNTMVNLGIGMPDGVAAVAAEEGISDRATLAVEGGPVGGVGLGACINPEAVYRITDNFDWYDGGGLNMAFLGAAQIDKEGNVNVSRFGTRCPGPGGFINITQNTPEVYFMGTFTAGKMDCEIADGALKIVEDAPGIKFVEKVEQITFSAQYARETGQKVTFITERAVFALTDKGLTLTEIAPGVDLERDILSKMEFYPHISEHLKQMDPRIFRPEPMGLAVEQPTVE